MSNPRLFVEVFDSRCVVVYRHWCNLVTWADFLDSFGTTVAHDPMIWKLNLWFRDAETSYKQFNNIRCFTLSMCNVMLSLTQITVVLFIMHARGRFLIYIEKLDMFVGGRWYATFNCKSLVWQFIVRYFIKLYELSSYIK